jgi:hypothetical protein
MKNIYELDTRAVGEAAKYFTAFRVTLFGTDVEIRKGIKNEVIAKSKDGNRVLYLRIKSRRSGHWQIPTTEGCAPDVHVDEREYWVLVDFSISADTPDCYVMPGKWLRNDIYKKHQDYLMAHGGDRPVTPGSTHHSVTLEDIEQWKNRWEILGI